MDHKFAAEEAYISQNEVSASCSPKSYSPRKQYRKSPPVFWELKNGDKIDIDLMSVDHLRNTLKLIVNNGLLKEKIT